MTLRHFLSIRDLSKSELAGLLASASKMKKLRVAAGMPKGALDEDAALKGHVLALIFEQPSTRTRVSFDSAMRQLGGSSIVLNKSELQLGRGETVGDTARVLSRYIDIIAVRTDEQQKLIDMTASGSVPIINAMTNVGHPCQILADLLTLQENFGDLTGKKITWIGDFHNMCLSWMEAAEKLGFTLRLSVPEAYQPEPSVLQQAAARGASVEFFADPGEAADGADCVMTDVWVSLSQSDREPRLKAFRPFQVNEALMKRAKPTAVFLHCLPAHRGEEVTDGVIDGPQSLAWDQAENRMHAQKAVLRWCLGL